MKFVSSLIVVVIIFEFISFQHVEAKIATATATASAIAHVDPCCHVVCPASFLPATNPSDPASSNPLILMKELWNRTTPELSCEAKRLKKVMLKMLDSTSNTTSWLEVAYITSVSFWSSVDLLSQNIDLCTLAQMINATVVWETKHCCKTLNKAVDAMGLTFGDRVNLMLAATFKSAGCEQPPVLPAKISCYGNGSVYKIKKFWKQNKKDYPCKFVKSILKLYKSKNPIDRYLALVATVSSSKILRKLVVQFDPTLTLKLFGFQGLPKINKCCCPKLQAELKGLIDKNNADAVKTTAATKALFNC